MPTPPSNANIPAGDPCAPAVLGRAGMRIAAAVRHGSWRGHLAHGDVPAGAWTRAVARSVRSALAPAEQRTVGRDPEPDAALLPVPGRAEAGARRHSRALSRIAPGARLRSA